MTARRLAADWVCTMDGAPIHRGAVLIGSDGRIAAVGPEHRVPAPPDVPAEVFSGAVLLPGLINTHTHLELTGFDAQEQEPDFSLWIRRLRARKAERSADQFFAAACRGVCDMFAQGVTTVADTGDSGTVIRALAELGGRGIVYHEVFGPHPSQLAESMRGLETKIEELSAWTSDRVQLGVSPHAPYTVSGPLYRAAAAWARRESLPLAVHLAESPAETKLVTRHGGPFAEAWNGRGIPPLADQWDGSASDRTEPLRSPVAWLDAHGVLGTSTLCIHLIQVDARDLVILGARGVAMAHCPLSNHAHGHGRAPLAALLGAGIRVGIGTDSVASRSPLDLLAEASAARKAAGLSPLEALELVTTRAAAALGGEGKIGVLRVGAWGDCAVFGGGEPAAGRLPDWIVGQSGEGCLATFVAGRPVYRKGLPLD